MAVRQIPFVLGTVSGTGVNEIYETPADVTERPFLVLTNTDGAALVEAEVSIESDATVRTLVRGKIPAGIGKAWRVLEISDIRLAAGYKVGLELISGGPVNYFLSGVQYDVE